jgi:DNA-binding NarL/FixJ family response regulator
MSDDGSSSDEDEFWRRLVDGSAEWQTGKVAERLWRGLLVGHRVVVATGAGDALFLLTRDVPGSLRARHAFTRNQVSVLRRAARGQSNQAVAAALSITQGAASTSLWKSLRKLGLRSRAQLRWFSRGRTRLAPPFSTRVTRLVTSRGDLAVFVCPMPRFAGESPLTPAETDVAPRVLQGKTNREIAMERRTSQRTVANQVVAVRSKLESSSRVEIVVARSSPFDAGPPPDRVPVEVVRRFVQSAWETKPDA